MLPRNRSMYTSPYYFSFLEGMIVSSFLPLSLPVPADVSSDSEADGGGGKERSRTGDL